MSTNLKLYPWGYRKAESVAIPHFLLVDGLLVARQA